MVTGYFLFLTLFLFLLTHPMSVNRQAFRKHLEEVLGVEELDDKVDLLIYLDYVLFMEKLAQETEKEKQKAQKNKKIITLKTADINKHVENVLNEFRG
ncbi:hypothetical protein EDC94DRAFT_316892 [Helicostylum pulchrum]|nr:hypothetical protein EDC94DRAFT_316892 [Helicostylum pulchrum]